MRTVVPSYVNLNMPKQDIRKISNAGFDNIMLDFSRIYNPVNLSTYEDEEPDYTAFLNCCSDFGMKIVMAMAPILNPGIERLKKIYRYSDIRKSRELISLDDVIDKLIGITYKCIEFSGQLGCEYIVVQPLFAGVDSNNLWCVNHDYYMKLGELASKYNIMILLENLYTDFNGHLVRGVCSNPYMAVKWIDDLNAEIGSEVFGFCMDVGVCNVCGQNMYDFALVLGSRIKAVVMRDGDGIKAAGRQLPYTCLRGGRSETDWLNLIRGLRKIEFDGQIIMEFCDNVYALPLRLQHYVYEMAYEMGEYFIWQLEIEKVIRKYDKRVLFGAGNMCRNYMKCYGEEYPPLFTCDNNKAIWGTYFEGLEIKSPEELKSLDPDCAIFICNMYYDEIKQQLTEMGITNPIEYFNDENMPSLYLDRFDSYKREVR